MVKRNVRASTELLARALQNPCPEPEEPQSGCTAAGGFCARVPTLPLIYETTRCLSSSKRNYRVSTGQRAGASGTVLRPGVPADPPLAPAAQQKAGRIPRSKIGPLVVFEPVAVREALGADTAPTPAERSRGQEGRHASSAFAPGPTERGPRSGKADGWANSCRQPTRAGDSADLGTTRTPHFSACPHAG